MITLILYPPGSGGNHLKNLICLGARFTNTENIDHEQIYWHNPASLIGEVPAEGGRNVHEWNMAEFTQSPEKDWILACHFGELAAWREQIREIVKHSVVLSIDTHTDQQWLQRRQNRLGQHLHPYWISEELPWLYQPQMLACYFGINAAHSMTLPMCEFWSEDIGPTIDRLDQHLGTRIPKDQAQKLHLRWREINQLTNN